jgi:hypothetical protein
MGMAEGGVKVEEYEMDGLQLQILLLSVSLMVSLK